MIPLSTTTITVEQEGTESANYEAPTLTQIASGIRAHIGAPSGNETMQGGSRESVLFRLDCDPIDLDATCQITDEQTGERYRVVWAKQRRGLGVDHTVADLRQVHGVG